MKDHREQPRLTHEGYNEAFYDENVAGSLSSARVIVPLVLSLFPIRSVLDVGCGAGSWLSEFVRNGIIDYEGVDGSYLPTSVLQIPLDHFRTVDLASVGDFGRRFDLVCCLEVAEHLPKRNAESLVAALVRAAPIVLFSAAVPGQGGTHHVNEQWQSYWANLFSQRAYVCVDCIRPKIFYDEHVEWWYRQNALIFCEQGRISENVNVESTRYMIDRAHPRLVEKLVRERETRYKECCLKDL